MKGIEGHKFEHGYEVKWHENHLDIPKLYSNPHVFAVSLGSDLFHEAVPFEFIQRAFEVMNDTPRHLYEICTKRAERLGKLAQRLVWSSNISIGVTVESAKEKWRIDHLKNVPASYRYISMVPLLGDVGELDLEGIDGLGFAPEEWGLKRPCKQEWIDSIVRQCEEQGVTLLSGIDEYEVEA